MGRLNTVLAAMIATTTAPVVASAADFSSRPPVIEQASVVPEEIGTGWYLRGDVGYSRQAQPTANWYDPTNGTYGIGGVKSGDAVTAGLGFGYKFNDWLRSDLTLDYVSPSSLSGTGLTTPTFYDQTKVESVTLMWNGYLDLGNYSGFTPYLGAGLGVSRVSASTTSRDTSGTYSALAQAQKYSLAAAGMAGFAVDIGHGIQADVGYRYLWIDAGQTGELFGTGGHDTFKNLASHQFRVGLRYYMN
ncbi:MAG: OmpW family outer membrane protein [Ancalomicrobiaceae bacterium]|nr:OmpW family outer membrane protein [Ancalomicrobiaceae bacterium]